jgi:hypothetical protein
MRVVFVDNIVLKKNLSHFIEIHLQLAGIRVTKTCLKHEIMKTEKQGSKIPSNLPIHDSCVKNEQG